MTKFEDILYAAADGVATITLNRPDKLNAWTAAMQSSIKSAMEEAANDDSVRAIVVTGAGRGFCAGADMGGLQQIDAAKWDERALARVDHEVNLKARFDLPDISQHRRGIHNTDTPEEILVLEVILDRKDIELQS